MPTRRSAHATRTRTRTTRTTTKTLICLVNEGKGRTTQQHVEQIRFLNTRARHAAIQGGGTFQNRINPKGQREKTRIAIRVACAYAALVPRTSRGGRRRREGRRWRRQQTRTSGRPPRSPGRPRLETRGSRRRAAAVPTTSGPKRQSKNLPTGTRASTRTPSRARANNRTRLPARPPKRPNQNNCLGGETAVVGRKVVPISSPK